MIMYRIVELDVWGNASSGFEINNWHSTNEFICLSDDKPPSDRQIVAALKQAGLIKKNVRYTSIAIVDLGDTLVVEDARTGEPLLNLELKK